MLRLVFSHCFFIVRAENWDVRAINLQKQAHLLTPAELKRRGITRYDAEIILSQGIKLPDPKLPRNVGRQPPKRKPAAGE